MENLNEFVPEVNFELIPIKNLVSNQEYQRNLSRSHIEKAAANFDIFQINPVKVSRRDGINYVINGQHTIEIVALVSNSRETPVWCMVYDELCYKHEADIFANQQKFVKPLKPYEVYMANLEAGNDDQLIIQGLVESYGLKIGNSKAYCTICAISTLESIYIKYGYHVLSRCLRLIISTWEGDMNSFSANILKGVTKLIVVFGDSLNDEMFKERVGEVSVKQITRTAKERHAGSIGFAEAMAIQYNGKKKNPAQRLSLARLQAKETDIFFDIDKPDFDDDSVLDNDAEFTD